MPGSRSQKNVMRNAIKPGSHCVDDNQGSGKPGGSNQTKQPGYSKPKQVGKKTMVAGNATSYVK